MAEAFSIQKLFAGHELPVDLSSMPPSAVEDMQRGAESLERQRHDELMRSPDRLRSLGQFALTDPIDDVAA